MTFRVSRMLAEARPSAPEDDHPRRRRPAGGPFYCAARALWELRRAACVMPGELRTTRHSIDHEVKTAVPPACTGDAAEPAKEPPTMPTIAAALILESPAAIAATWVHRWLSRRAPMHLPLAADRAVQVTDFRLVGHAANAWR
jgi:hypothetical protein